jgi:Xaa-Pro aminopeptidase
MDRISCIRQAQAITDLVFEQILSYIKPGLTDAQVARKIDQLLRYYGSDQELAFKTLVCSGERTALFHGPTSAKKIIKKNEPIYLDFGARYKGWCADMTRTLFIGKPSQRLKTIYQAVLDCQELQLALVKSGVACSAIDEAGREYLKSLSIKSHVYLTDQMKYCVQTRSSLLNQAYILKA